MSDHLRATAAVVDGAVAPDGEEDPCELSGQGDDRGAAPAALFDSLRPELQRNGLGLRQRKCSAQAACTRTQRSARGPAFVIDSRCCRSALELSPGTRPRYDSTW